jgi:hypothetical protein
MADVGVPPFVKDQADLSKPLEVNKMSDDEFNATWVRSVARNGRSDFEMRALHPDLDAYKLNEKSDMISYHTKPNQKALTS